MIKTLLVDDDALVRMFLRQMIVWKDEGCTVIGDARLIRIPLSKPVGKGRLSFTGLSPLSFDTIDNC